MDGADLHLFPIDHQAAFRSRIGNGPAAVIVSGQNGMVSRHRWKVNGHVTAFASADDIFPVGNGDLTAVRHIQPCPNFRLLPKGQQGQNAPHQQKHRNQGHDITHGVDHHIHQLLLLHQGIQQILHAITSFSLSLYNGIVFFICQMNEFLTIFQAPQQSDLLGVSRQFVGGLQDHGLVLQ